MSKFRSANEFVPHVIWLLTDETLNHSECKCKYSTKKPQKEISSEMGLPIFRGPTGSPVPSAARKAKPQNRPREPRYKETKPYAGVRRAPKPTKKLTGPTRSIVPDRDRDIVAALADGAITPPRMFRRGELVWCHLNPPIPGRLGPENDIAFWPCIVESTSLKSEPVEKEIPPEEAANPPEIAVPNTYWGLVPFPPPHAPKPPITWNIRQHNTYKLKLLGTPYFCNVYDEDALPYLAYTPSNSLLGTIREALEESLQTADIEELNKNLELTFDFNPHGSDPESAKDPSRFNQAVAPITLAIEIAANVIKYWTPTDEWDMQFTIPPVQTSASANASQTLSTTLAAAMKMNEKQLQSPGGSISAPVGTATVEAQQPYDVRLGPESAPRNIPHTITQLRYQGLWWGGERIWVDELVRLKLARCQFAPKGTEVVYPPAGPSESTVQGSTNRVAMDGSNPQPSGADEKGLFMRLEGLFVVDVPQADGSVVKECRTSGMLFELVEEDWEGNPPAQSQPVAANGNGKGKERAVDVGPPNSEGVDSANEPPSSQLPPPTQSSSQIPPSSQGDTNGLASSQPDGTQSSQEHATESSHPVLSTPYPFPRPPRGFKFRPILPQGHEVVISLSLISGRYYPRLFEHPLLGSMIEEAIRQSLTSEGGLFASRHIWAMEGLLPGAFQAMDPVHWLGNRSQMLKQADESSRNSFRELIEFVKRSRRQPEGGQASGSGDAEMVDTFGPEPSTSISTVA